MTEHLTTKEKIAVIGSSPEVKDCFILLIAAFNDMDLKSHIRYGYEDSQFLYEMTFLKIDKNNITKL